MQPMLSKIFRCPVHRVLSTKRIHNIQCIDVSPKVKQAFKLGQPVVALESTIITHGMPYPQNMETALAVEEAVSAQGAVPATIAIIKGRIKVGLELDMLSDLATLKTPAVKTSRRDFPYVLSKGLNGGTTVSGTIAVSNLVGIMVFATGGMGGVHREGHVTMDVSADLTELGRSPILVVSSGVKSILDIGRTLEFLETQGVCVATYGGNRTFPAFYSSQSEFQSPYCVETPLEVASLFYSLLQLQQSSGILLAVPIPKGNALEDDKIEAAIQSAVQDAAKEGVIGKDLTPYILSKVNQLTSGKSLLANMALVKNNAKVAAQVAVELTDLQRGMNPSRVNDVCEEDSRK